ncbi:MAG: AraC family transcriptional regulator [Pseudobacteriovorax sp.]|nr:AraC family transcriptional regulator [Pseudobacteriovorax sp.]
MHVKVSGQYVRAALEGAIYQGYPVRSWLQSLDIDPVILKDQSLFIDSLKYSQLIQRVWMETQDEYMGFFSQSAKPGTFYLMSLTMIHGDSLRVFFERSVKFYELITENFRFVFEIQGDIARLHLTKVHSLVTPDFIIEVLLAVWHRFASWLGGVQIHLKRVGLQYDSPRFRESNSDLFFCPVEYGSKTSFIEFPSYCLELPIVQSERSLRRFLGRSPLALIFRLSMSDSLSSRVRAELYQSDLSFTSSGIQMAERLGLSAPTLRRRLRKEGTSFQEIRDNLRRDLALAHLEKRATIEELCQATGFSDPSAFYRAFKRWKGVTPLTFIKDSAARGGS